uniref:Uncharacterized protein n=1 Tax=Leptospira ellisii TaxID=2023197 RepID=A0A2N0B3F5_9LEPT|nr:hypothetical protein CH379_20820 [Leptospira ellisii]
MAIATGIGDGFSNLKKPFAANKKIKPNQRSKTEVRGKMDRGFTLETAVIITNKVKIKVIPIKTMPRTSSN